MTNFDNSRPGPSEKQLIFPIRRGPSPNSHRNKDDHHRYDDSQFAITDPRGRALTLFARQGDKHPYRIGPLYQQSIRQGFLEHGGSMLDNLSAREKQLLLSDLLHAVRVGKDQQTITDVKHMIEQTINHKAQDATKTLTPEVFRDTLIPAIHVYPTAPPSRRIQAINLATLIEIAEIMIPRLPHTVETAEQITAAFSHSIDALSESVKEIARVRARVKGRERVRENEREHIASLNQQLDSLQRHMLEASNL